jgi:MOSC domain-containing protein YiiM
MGQILSVNVGGIREVEFAGKTVRTGIWKSPVAGRRPVRGVNIAGDAQGDLAVHGGVDKAIYAYAAEDYRWWKEEFGLELEPGTFGDNLTTVGMDLKGALVGERWRVGTALLEVAEPRIPCFKLGIRMEDPGFPHLFAWVARWGAYFRIIEEGEIGAGEGAELVSRPSHGVTVGLVAEVYYEDHARAGELLAAPQLPSSWRDWAERSLSRKLART